MPGLPPGKLNAITDVRGVGVGHCTVIEGDSIRTGVTAVLPHPGNLFVHKVPAAVEVINGFGKAVGLSQVKELGEIETPIILTNTLSVGVALDALVEYKLERNPEIGRKFPTVNGVVAECNDGFLNDIRARRHPPARRAAIAAAVPGCPGRQCGGGTGMSSLTQRRHRHQFPGGRALYRRGAGAEQLWALAPVEDCRCAGGQLLPGPNRPGRSRVP